MATRTAIITKISFLFKSTVLCDTCGKIGAAGMDSTDESACETLSSMFKTPAVIKWG